MQACETATHDLEDDQLRLVAEQLRPTYFVSHRENVLDRGLDTLVTHQPSRRRAHASAEQRHNAHVDYLVTFGVRLLESAVHSGVAHVVHRARSSTHVWVHEALCQQPLYRVQRSRSGRAAGLLGLDDSQEWLQGRVRVYFGRADGRGRHADDLCCQLREPGDQRALVMQRPGLQPEAAVSPQAREHCHDLSLEWPELRAAEPGAASLL